MQDARYLRVQAALCLEIADQMSDPKSREKMRADAAEFHARADALEKGEENVRVEIVLPRAVNVPMSFLAPLMEISMNEHSQRWELRKARLVLRNCLRAYFAVLRLPVAGQTPLSHPTSHL